MVTFIYDSLLDANFAIFVSREKKKHSINFKKKSEEPSKTSRVDRFVFSRRFKSVPEIINIHRRR